MFNKKTRRNFRQRKGGSSGEEDEEKHSGNDKDNEKAAVVVNRPLKQPQSRGISCSSKREAPLSKSDSSDDSGNDGEDREELTVEINQNPEVKKKTNAMLSFSDEGGESEFKLKKTIDKAVLFQLRRKEASPKTSQNTTITSTVDHQITSTVDHQSSAQREDAGKASSQSSSPSSYGHSSDDNDIDSRVDDKVVDKQHDSLSPSSSSGSSCRSSTKQVVIPSAKEIEAARRQRRANRTKKEYIPLDKDDYSSAPSTPERLSQKDEEDNEEDNEDDDDDELDDHERRIEFAPKPKSIRERIAEKLGGSDGSHSETDEEQELWEETQIGKGVKRRPGEQSPSGSESSSYSSSRHQQRRLKKSIPALPSVSVSMIKKRITVKLDSLKEVHRARQAEYRRMEGDIENARCSAETLEEGSLELQLKFYRETTVYTHNLVECLREKIVEINSLELELHTLLSDQMESLLSQRRQKVKEQADHLQQLSYKPDEHTANNVNGKEILSEPAPTLTEEDLDIPEDTQPSAEEEEQCQTQIEDILLRSQAIFTDVKDDFYDVKKILSRFEEWRQSYSDTYHNAYISLCLPKLLNPIVRHQLLAWNPLKDTSEDFENMPWFSALETFCHGHGHEELERTDRQTLSNVIEKTLIPKLTAYVEMVWDPMSLCQTVCLTNVCHKLKDDYSVFEGEHCKPVKAFIDVVVSRLRSCVDEDIFIPLYPKRFLDDRSSPQCHFRDQQFWTAIKLLCIMGKWEFVIPESTLKDLMLDKLLSRYLMITLSNSTQTLKACKQIAESLPCSWCREENNCLPQLQTFRNYLVKMVHSICKEQSSKEPSTRSVVIEVLQLLSRIRCYDSIMAIAEKYHYEDAIYTHQLLNQDSA